MVQVEERVSLMQNIGLFQWVEPAALQPIAQQMTESGSRVLRFASTTPASPRLRAHPRLCAAPSGWLEISPRPGLGFTTTPWR